MCNHGYKNDEDSNCRNNDNDDDGKDNQNYNRYIGTVGIIIHIFVLIGVIDMLISISITPIITYYQLSLSLTIIIIIKNLRNRNNYEKMIMIMMVLVVVLVLLKVLALAAAVILKATSINAINSMGTESNKNHCNGLTLNFEIMKTLNTEVSREYKQKGSYFH